MEMHCGRYVGKVAWRDSHRESKGKRTKGGKEEGMQGRVEGKKWKIHLVVGKKRVKEDDSKRIN